MCKDKKLFLKVYGEFSANTPVNYQPLSSPVYDSNGQDHLNGTNRNQYHQKGELLYFKQIGYKYFSYNI